MTALTDSAAHKQQPLTREHALTELKRHKAIDPATRHFILTNLIPAKTQDQSGGGAAAAAAEVMRWRVNLPVLRTEERHIHSWPDSIMPDQGKTYSRPALFIGATNSTRLMTPAYTGAARRLFPTHTLEVLPGGHFIQNAEPLRCSQLIAQFLAREFVQKS